MDRVALLVTDATDRGPNEVAITARCLARVTVGMTVSDVARTTALRLATIERYPGVYVDVLEPPHTARIVLRGARTDQVKPGAGLIIHEDQADEGGFSHLLPLVQALLDAGNELVAHPHTTAAFRPSQGGYYCPMTGPLRFDAIRDLPRRPEVYLDEANDNIYCQHCWTIIYGGRYQSVIHRS